MPALQISLGFSESFLLDTPVNGTTNTDKGAPWNSESLCLHHFFVVVCVCEVDSTAFAYIYVNNVD